jgi:tripartite-type tricarboxylate transporter receptor subunit TctC
MATLFLPTNTTYVILPEQRDSLPFDLDRDFAPIAFVSETPMMVAASPTAGVSSLPGLIALSKKTPGELFYSAGTRGALPHLAGELLRSQTGAELTFVPYPNDKAGLNDVVAGRISAVVAAVGALTGTAQAGAIVPLAVTSDRRLPNFPDLPTAAETTPGFAATAWFLLAAPGATPLPIVQKINRDLNAVLAADELKKRLHDLGAFQRILTPAQTTDFIRTEQQKWRPLVRKMNLKL